MDTAFLGIAALGRRYRDKTLVPRGAVDLALARLIHWEPRLNAFAHVMAEAARADADRLGAELAAGQDRGPLHGIPIAVKDLIDIAGEPTGFGSKVLSPAPAQSDAELVGRLRRAGAVIIGKTNLLEYAYGVAHPQVGQTNNPHDPSRTSGGSSGGSAAVVAAGIVPLAIGTDTGGSIRIPAAYCGIVGLKPSFGLVPLQGVFPLSQSLDHAGPLAGNVEDCALGLAVLCARAIELLPVSLQGLRIGIIGPHFASAEVTSGVRRNLEAALTLLRTHGVQARPVDIPYLARANRALGTILRPEASLIHAELEKFNPGGYAPQTLAQIASGRNITAVDYLDALQFRAFLRHNVEALFETVDVLVSPSVPFAAPISDPVVEDGEDGEMLSSGLANLTGHPAISLPIGLDGILPVGLQLLGPAGKDGRLLSIARSIETVLQFDRRPADALAG